MLGDLIGRTEDDSDRDGFLSTFSEWHAFAIGIRHGLSDSLTSVRPLPEIDDVQQEPATYSGGYVVGTLIQLLAIALLGGAAKLSISGGLPL